VGDVSPRYHGDRPARDVGRDLAAAVRQAASDATTVARPNLTVATVAVALPSPRLSLKNCLGGWAPGGWGIPLGAVFPRETAMTAIAIGDVAVVTAPGELQTKLGLAIKRAGHTHFTRTLLAGVSNDYLGYFVSAADYGQPGYVTCGTLYGPGTGDCLAGAAAGLLARLGRGERAAGARVTCDGG
jgi:hypothetical protein